VPRLTAGDLADGCLATYLHPPFFDDPDLAEPFFRVSRGAATMRMLGSGSIDLASVACGAHTVWCQHSCPEWDGLPGRALGGRAGSAPRSRSTATAGLSPAARARSSRPWRCSAADSARPSPANS